MTSAVLRARYAAVTTQQITQDAMQPVSILLGVSDVNAQEDIV